MQPINCTREAVHDFMIYDNADLIKNNMVMIICKQCGAAYGHTTKNLQSSDNQVVEGGID